MSFNRKFAGARAAGAIVVAALLSVTAASCNTGLTPSGLTGPAAGSSQVGAGGNTGTKTGKTRMWGWNAEEATVLGLFNFTGPLFFCDTHINVSANASVAFVVNGVPAQNPPILPASLFGQSANPDAFVIDPGDMFQTAQQTGATPFTVNVNDICQFVIFNTGTQAYVSNPVIVKAGPYQSGNSGPPFEATTPATGVTNAPRATVFEFKDAAAASTYNLVVMKFSSGSAGLQPDFNDLFPINVELPANLQYTAGQSAVNASSVLTDEELAPTGGGAYGWNVVALDIDGWGVGTTIDLTNFSTQQGQATYPLFDTQ